MREKTLKNITILFSGIFSPFLVTTIGSLVILNYLPGYEIYSTKLKYILISVIFVSTCILPFIFTQTLYLSQRFKKNTNENRDRLIPYIFSAFSIFLGAQLVARLPIPSIFRLYMLGSCLILILLFFISLKWKISSHAAGIGAMLGIFLALIFKYGIALQLIIMVAIIVSGLMGTSRIYLAKNNPAQVYAGFTLSILSMYLTIYFF